MSELDNEIKKIKNRLKIFLIKDKSNKNIPILLDKLNNLFIEQEKTQINKSVIIENNIYINKN